MVLARIVGTVVATRKDPRLVSNKLLLARPVDPRDRSRLDGGYLVAVDTVDPAPEREPPAEHLDHGTGRLAAERPLEERRP